MSETSDESSIFAGAEKFIGDLGGLFGSGVKALQEVNSLFGDDDNEPSPEMQTIYVPQTPNEQSNTSAGMSQFQKWSLIIGGAGVALTMMIAVLKR